ncbi:hypothetical protein CLOLEP_00218 [[Clostridium] leptum DSM 753]|uniref:Uncharacterized protein n=1 Tax=[Clostridium] leptum DSM 753 TaxID=428125 RepID=A7VNU2_9FIRM|nr:hypothetical protein CLOLEP_00218 [[Clostridium] leptum DSM 753]
MFGSNLDSYRERQEIIPTFRVNRSLVVTFSGFSIRIEVPFGKA